MASNAGRYSQQAQSVLASQHWSLVLVTAAIILTANSGCKRSFYRRTADRDAHSILSEKGAGPTWQLQPGFTIEPDQRSRFYDPTCPTDPELPIPAPQLYNYQLPPLSTTPAKPRDLASSTIAEESPAAGSAESTTPADVPDENAAGLPLPSAEEIVPAPQPGQDAPVPQLAPPTVPSSESSSRIRPLTPPPTSPAVVASSALALVSAHGLINTAPPVDLSTPLTTARDEKQSPAESLSPVEELPSPQELLKIFGQEEISILPPSPDSAWESLPVNCLRRMLEFESVREEYERTFNRRVEESQLDPAERVNLENILEIALINSREFQTRKETLYRTALLLSLRRFDYEIKFFRSRNGGTLGYQHLRAGGVEVNRLSVGPQIGIQKSLYTAGDLVARFANDVVLTFNGPSGFSSSIGSELLLELSQPLIQRDVQFESLTQAERNVVYAARDFVRFRKQLFRDLAVQHYNLLLTYRNIAINTQDYFSNLNGFNRSAAYEQVGQLPLFQVDQFEQNVLRSRGNLINSCNSLEQSLDRLKLRIGLPPEMPLNLDLSELEELTLRDEATVIRDQIRRKRSFAERQLDRAGPEAAVPAAAEMVRRMYNLSVVNERLGQSDAAGVRELQILVARLEVEDRRIKARLNAQVLKEFGSEDAVVEGQIYLRKLEVIESTLEAIQHELLLMQLIIADEDFVKASGDGQNSISESAIKIAATQRLIDKWYQLVIEYEELPTAVELTGELLKVPYAEQADRLIELVASAEERASNTEAFENQVVVELDRIGMTLAADENDLAVLAEFVIETSGSGVFASNDMGLPPLEVNMDDAMLTALVQRLDLLNQRGELADRWRQIKYAGDDLKSVLNVRATQSVRTRTGSNSPFDFTFDDSTTTLGLDFDTPLNRRIERNNFRLSLINYNLALRNLIEAQDVVKLDIRDDLRAIGLDRDQYEIAIASAALAYERVASTRLQLATGQRNVSARDFLEAQQAYTQSLSSVAQRHIGYIIDRIEFFLDLEQLQVDENNFWSELRNEEYAFLPNFDYGRTAPDGYGCLPPGPWFSKCLRRMEQVPPGVSVIHRPMEIEVIGQ